MSTLPGLASKGEKGKSKYQSLDINNLYKVYTTEPLETQQQKNTLPRKHGMQSLGKVPTARRPPANLPSLKSEHTGSDAAVSLVPSGGAGWGKQDPSSPSTSTPPSTSTTTNSNATNVSPANVQLTTPPVNALPVVATPIPPPNKNHVTPTATPVTADKSWSSVMSGADLLQPPPYQSPQFQHEFPSLSAGDGVPQRTGSDTQYGPGPSLRPQTEGSWIQGGSRAGTEAPPRSNSAPLGPPPQLTGPVGPNQQQPLPPQFRGLIPPFMYRGNFAPNGHGGPNFANIPGAMNNGRNRLQENRGTGRSADSDEFCHRPIIREEDLNRMDDMTRDVGWASHEDIDYNQKLAFSDDEAEMEKGNRHVSLHREHDKTEHNLQEAHSKNWGASKTGSIAQPNASQGGRSRTNEEDEVWIQRRRQQSEEVAMVIERAKQRKEVEEKRFLETKQAAAKKLQQLEEKINRSKHDKEVDDSQGTINPLVVPHQPITPVPIPVPDWEREKDGRSHTPVENTSGKGQYRESTSDFRKLTQIEGRSFVRKETRSADRDSRDRERDVREQGGPSFSKQFQSNLPPRFQKQQQLRNNASSSPQPQGTGVPFAEQYDVRWQQSQNFNKNSSSIRKGRQEVDELENKEQEDERKDNKRLGTDEGYRGSYRSYTEATPKPESKYEDGRDYRGHDFDYRRDRNDDKWEKDTKPEKRNSQQDLIDEHNVNRHSSDECRNDRREKYEEKFQDRFERPQRPDSRDSRTSRESRHSRESTRDSEPREYHGSWADTPFEPTYDDRRKEHFREDRRSVPGPITKERIEAEDLKPEKKNLTQLKRGYMTDKRGLDSKKEEQGIEKNADGGWAEQKNKDETENDDLGVSKAWADAISPNTVAPENPKFMEVLEKTGKNSSSVDSIKEETKQDDDSKKGDKGIHDKDKDDKRLLAANRRRGDPRDPRPQGQGWGGSGYVYHRSSWSKKNDSRRGSRMGGPKKSSGKSGDWHGTDSDGSIDEVSVSTESGKDERSVRMSQRSPKTTKKYEKDEKNKEMRQDKPISSDRKFESGRRDNYVPRGEPSRHGRGASNFRSRGGLSKRIDGYGPPPSKSPFGQLEDKDKKISNDEATTDNASSDEKTKQNQQALSAGIIGSHNVNKDSSGFTKKSEDKSDSNKGRSMSSMQRPKKLKSDDSIANDNCDTSDNSDESGLKEPKLLRKFNSKSSLSGTGINRSSSANNLTRRNNPPPRFASDKRGNYNSRNESSSLRQNSTGSLKSGYGNVKKEGIKIDENKSNDFMSSLCPSDKLCKSKESSEEIEHGDGELDEKSSAVCDSDGFQEVKSKKTGQRQKSCEDKPVIKPVMKTEKDNKVVERKKPNGSTPQLTPQQIANIPSLMDTPVNPPSVVPQLTNKNQFDRSRQNKLPPRFAKQRENNRLQKAQMQQGICDINEMNKVNHNINMYGLKDGSNTAPGRISNAWEKPLSTHLRTDQDGMLTVGIDTTKTLEQPQQSASQSNSPNIDKVMKSNHLQEKTVLDGTTPPVNTIIFENTNFKSAPGTRPSRPDKSCSNKLDESGIEQAVISSFNKPIRDLLNKNDKQSESIQMQLTFSKEDSADMKLDFFESELSHLTDDKSSKNMGLPRSMHTITSANNTISPSTADALNFKIASVKKVWETMPTVIEHSVGQEDSNSSFSTSFGPDPNSLDPSSAFGKGGDGVDDSHEGYSSSPNQPTSNNTTNVCKVKPTQQVAGTTGQAVHATAHQQHSGVVGPGIVGHPLSPPPMQPVIGAGVGLGQPPQPYTSNQHLGYQPSLGGSTQYGMSAIPSPPTVLFNSTQQIQAAQTGLYGAFQIDQSQVLGGQGRSQYSQYPNPYSLGQTASSPYSAQSMYLQGAQPHPPPTAQAPPDLYQNLNNYRLPATGPFGQSQQLNNPTTVLISSTSNSLMSATVKPSTQQISAIGTKASGAGQAYQQQSQQGQQLYMTYDPTMQANYLPSTGVMQRGPTAPLQNNVALQPSSSYYTGSTGGQTGFYQQPGSSTLPSAQLQQHQAGYGLQGNVFGTPNQSHTSAGLQNFSSHFLSSPMQIAAAAALNAQQYRSTNLQSSPYVKGVNNHVGDQNSRPQQIKSPGSQQDVLSSVFNSGPQIPSPKSRQNMKQPPPQPSPTAQHKYNLYQTVGNQQSAQTQRYPTPIQRPVTFQPAVGTIQSNSNVSNNQKHRATNQTSKLAARNYYGTQGSNLSTTQSDKVEDSKLGDSATPNSSNSAIVSNTSSIVSKAVISSSAAAATAEITKDATKDENSVIKD